MAIDSRDKRASLMASGIEAHIVLPTPGTHTQGDRQQVSGLYRGILARILAYIGQTPLERIYKMLAESRVLSVEYEARRMAVDEELRVMD